jgi:hypothetical protein
MSREATDTGAGGSARRSIMNQHSRASGFRKCSAASSMRQRALLWLQIVQIDPIQPCAVPPHDTCCHVIRRYLQGDE